MVRSRDVVQAEGSARTEGARRATGVRADGAAALWPGGGRRDEWRPVDLHPSGVWRAAGLPRVAPRPRRTPDTARGSHARRAASQAAPVAPLPGRASASRLTRAARGPWPLRRFLRIRQSITSRKHPLTRPPIMIDNYRYGSNYTDRPGRARPTPRHAGAAGRRHADHPEARRREYQPQHPTGLRRRAAALGRLARGRPG